MATKKRTREHFGRPPDPDDAWNEPDPDPVKADETCYRILKKIEDAPPDVWRRAAKFFEDVNLKVLEVHGAITQTRRVTRGQEKALAGWEGGIDKCLQG